jgi:hypothetical protein
MNLYSTGNLGINTSSDSGQRLQVQGTTLLNGNVTFSSSTGMFWDATNSRLGIGTNAPAYALDVVNNSRFRGTENYFGATNNNGIFSPATYSSANYPAIESNSIGFIAGITSVANTVYTVANKITFQIGTGSNSKKAEFATSTGNLLLQNGGTFTDSGERLQVTGNVLVKGSGGNVFFVKSSAGGNLFYIQNAGTIGFTTYSWVPESGSAVVSLDAGLARSWNVTGNKTNTSGVGSAFFVTSGFAPTSGTGVYNAQTINPTINQTGGANGITRGLYVNPTLTAAADFRAIETARGNVVFGNLPTSPVGLPTGAIWNDAGTIKIV